MAEVLVANRGLGQTGMLAGVDGTVDTTRVRIHKLKALRPGNIVPYLYEYLSPEAARQAAKYCYNTAALINRVGQELTLGNRVLVATVPGYSHIMEVVTPQGKEFVTDRSVQHLMDVVAPTAYPGGEKSQDPGAVVRRALESARFRQIPFLLALQPPCYSEPKTIRTFWQTS